MSVNDTLITAGIASSAIYKDILRPATTFGLTGVFTSGSYRAVAITNPITSPGIQMFFVEVNGASSPSAGETNGINIPGGLTFSKAYVVLRDMSPSNKLDLYLFWSGSNYVTFRITTSAAITNVSTSFLVIGV